MSLKTLSKVFSSSHFRKMVSLGSVRFWTGKSASQPSGPETTMMMQEGSPSTKHLTEFKQMLADMKGQSFDGIRFASYRAASKLRYLQRRLNLDKVDLWNMIEAFRQCGLHTLDPVSSWLGATPLMTLLNTVFGQLNQRLPANQQVNVEVCAHLVLHWLHAVYAVTTPKSTRKEDANALRLRVFSVKVALTTMCGGKLLDKLRYIFSQISDGQGVMNMSRFDAYVQEVLALPTALYEGPSYGYNETACDSCFHPRSRIVLSDFLNTMMSDPGPPCLVWLPVFHRMVTVENVFHPVACDACRRESFMGFRYKCQRCHNYQLCQECFWRGRTSGSHTVQHEMKEYTSYKSPAKQLTHSLKKSFRCLPTNSEPPIPTVPNNDTMEKKLDLSHIVPPTPVPQRSFLTSTPRPEMSAEKQAPSNTSTANRSGVSNASPKSNTDSMRVDDEHRLIARYAARLAADANRAARSPSENFTNYDEIREKRRLIEELETKNREILREIRHLRSEKLATTASQPFLRDRPYRSLEHGSRLQDALGPGSSSRSLATAQSPALMSELHTLRQRKDELEGRMTSLQQSRRELMVQLEGLMKLLRAQGQTPLSTPNSSPRTRTGMSPSRAMQGRSYSTPSTPPADSMANFSYESYRTYGSVSPQGTMSNGSHGQPQNPGYLRMLRNDLLVAADSVTNAMTSLVKELNSEASSGSEAEDDISPKQNNMFPRMAARKREQARRMDLETKLNQEFVQQIESRKKRFPREPRGTQSDTENYLVTGDTDNANKTDDETFLATDDEAVIRKRAMPIVQKEIALSARNEDDNLLQSDAESYIRTDDEEAANGEWDDKRWGLR